MEPITVVVINVGGSLFTTTAETLSSLPDKDILFTRMLSPEWQGGVTRDAEGNIFLDVTPELFESLLSALRSVRNRGRFKPLIADKYREEYKSFLNYYMKPFSVLEFEVFLSQNERLKFGLPFGNTNWDFQGNEASVQEWNNLEGRALETVSDIDGTGAWVKVEFEAGLWWWNPREGQRQCTLRCLIPIRFVSYYENRRERETNRLIQDSGEIHIFESSKEAPEPVEEGEKRSKVGYRRGS